MARQGLVLFREISVFSADPPDDGLIRDGIFYEAVGRELGGIRLVNDADGGGGGGGGNSQCQPGVSELTSAEKLDRYSCWHLHDLTGGGDKVALGAGNGSLLPERKEERTASCPRYRLPLRLLLSRKL